MKPTDEEIERRFMHHPPTEEAIDLHAEVRSQAADFALWLNQHLPESRELTNALTYLQDTTFWANAAIAIHISGAPSPLPPEISRALDAMGDR